MNLLLLTRGPLEAISPPFRESLSRSDRTSCSSTVVPGTPTRSRAEILEALGRPRALLDGKLLPGWRLQAINSNRFRGAPSPELFSGIIASDSPTEGQLRAFRETSGSIPAHPRTS